MLVPKQIRDDLKRELVDAVYNSQARKRGNEVWLAVMFRSAIILWLKDDSFKAVC